jgi:hypothetical protein
MSLSTDMMKCRSLTLPQCMWNVRPIFVYMPVSKVYSGFLVTRMYLDRFTRNFTYHSGRIPILHHVYAIFIQLFTNLFCKARNAIHPFLVLPPRRGRRLTCINPRNILFFRYTWDYNLKEVKCKASDWNPCSVPRIIEDGGVCGRQSTLARVTNHCLGIASGRIKQPGHAAGYTYTKLADGYRFKVSYIFHHLSLV